MLGHNYPGNYWYEATYRTQLIADGQVPNSRGRLPPTEGFLGNAPSTRSSRRPTKGTARARTAMLTTLSIRDVVLIERLDLSSSASGLTVLTGETGAGKSILLDSLGLALGARADQGLVRQGAEQASVAASFALPAGSCRHRRCSPNKAWRRRTRWCCAGWSAKDGRSRATINDQPVSVGPAAPGRGTAGGGPGPA